MRLHSTLAGLAMGVAVAGTLTACGEERAPIRPSPMPAATPASPVVRSLRLDGPTSIEPGGAGQFYAVAEYDDGSTRDVTSEAEWSSSDETSVSMGAGGLARGLAAGEADVSFEVGGRTSSATPVLVLEAGTVRLRGLVQEAGSPTGSVFGARVEVAGGPADGLTTTTDWFGKYSLLGVPVDAEVRVTRVGFESTVAAVRATIGASTRTLDVVLIRTTSRPDFSGIYRLHISANCAEGSPFPAAARERDYAAVLAQNGSSVQLRLTGADFEVDARSGRGNLVWGQAADAGVRLDLAGADDWGDYPSVVEGLSKETLLVIDGRVEAERTASGLAGTFHGFFSIYRRPFNPLERPAVSCESDSHSFTLSR